MFKIVVVPQPENNIVVTDFGGNYLRVSISKNVDANELRDILKEFGSAIIDNNRDEISLFVNPVYNKQTIIDFIQELN